MRQRHPRPKRRQPRRACRASSTWAPSNHRRRASKPDADVARAGVVAPMTTQDTFISHLVELRDRLLRAILAVLIVFLCLFPWAKDLYTLMAQPLLAVLPQGGQMIATDVVGVFLVPVKVALLVAFVIALPYVLYQIWAFVAPGLYAHEKLSLIHNLTLPT